MSAAGKTGIFLAGVDQFTRAAKLANVKTRANTVAAVRRGTKAVAAEAQRLAPRRSGEMAGTIRDDYSKDGMRGYVKAGVGKLPRRSHAGSAAGRARLANKRKAGGATTGLGAYAPVVERGDKRRGKPAEPFEGPALAHQRAAIIADIARAIDSGGRELER